VLDKPRSEGHGQLALEIADERVDKGGGHGDAEPLEHHAGKVLHVLLHYVLNHAALQGGHVDGEKGASDQGEGVDEQEAGLSALQTRNHDSQEEFESREKFL
jgi:hypothetical protein